MPRNWLYRNLCALLYDGNKLVCAVSETDEDEESMWVVRMAYRWARLRVTSGAERELGVDPEA